MVTLERPSLHTETPYRRLKALLDIPIAVVLLVCLSPLLLLIAVLVRLESAGPAIYRQWRVGSDGKLFTLYKFRTLLADAPCLSTEELQQLSSIPFTRLGPFLRKTSLDELPQLINIVRGEMTFIGPRPALPTQHDVNERRREMGIQGARPGLTGLAQVRGRDNLDTDTKVCYDAEYCRRMCFVMDLKIVLWTVSAVFSGHGSK